MSGMRLLKIPITGEMHVHFFVSCTSRHRPFSLFSSRCVDISAAAKNRDGRKNINDSNEGVESTIPEELVRELLEKDPDAASMVQRVADAARSVAELQMEQDRLREALEEAETSVQSSQEDRERQAASEAADLIAKGELKAAELRLRAAQLEAEMAEAQRSSAEMNLDLEAERVESAKAGALAALGAVLGSLPLVTNTTSSGLGILLQTGGTGVSAFLFGLVYRYVLRGEMQNVQLKSGVVAAFGLVRAIGQTSEYLATFDDAMDMQSVGRLLTESVESIILFGFAAAAVEIAISRKILQPYGRVADGKRTQESN